MSGDEEFEKVLVVVELEKPLAEMIEDHIEETEETLEEFFESASSRHMAAWKNLQKSLED